MVKCHWKEHSFCRFYRSWLFFTPGFHIVILLLFNPQAVSFAFQVFLAFHYKEWKQNRKYAKKLNIKLQKYVNLSLQKGWLYLKLKLLVFPTHIKWQMAGIISKFLHAMFLICFSTLKLLSSSLDLCNFKFLDFVKVVQKRKSIFCSSLFQSKTIQSHHLFC